MRMNCSNARQDIRYLSLDSFEYDLVVRAVDFVLNDSMSYLDFLEDNPESDEVLLLRKNNLLSSLLDKLKVDIHNYEILLSKLR